MTFWRRPWIAGALVLACGTQAVAQTTGATERLDELRQLVLYASYDEAIAGAREFLVRTDLSASERNAALELVAVALIANRERADAESTLAELFARDPEHVLSDANASPVVQRTFDRARQSATPAPPLEISGAPFGARPRREPVVFRISVAGADRVANVMLFSRVAGSGDFTMSGMAWDAVQGTASAQLEVEPGSAPYSLEYYIEARAPSGTALGSAGASSDPLRLEIPAPSAARAPSTASEHAPAAQRSEWYAPGTGPVGSHAQSGGGSLWGEWWFWTVVGALVVGAGAGTYFVVADAPEPPTGTLGALDLER